MPTVNLPLGPIDYRVVGPDDPSAPCAVFVHGFLADSTLWDAVATTAAKNGIRCLLPDWPLGSHTRPIPPESELSPGSVAAAITHLLTHLDLSDVTLVGNDTGGGLVQLALAGDTSRVGGVVLTNCDGFDVFPPRWFVPLFRIGRRRSLLWLLLQQTRLRMVRHSPFGYGRLLNRPRDAALTRRWVGPALDHAGVRRDINRFLRALKGDELVDSASWLSGFSGPVRVVWGTQDRCFTATLGRRIAAALRDAPFVEVVDATTFVPIDRPDAVAEAITAVSAAARGAR